MVALPIAFNAQQESSRFDRVFHRQVDEESRDSNLRNNIEATFLEDASDRPLKVVRRLLASFIRCFQNPGARENKIFLERPQAPKAAGSGLDDPDFFRVGGPKIL